MCLLCWNNASIYSGPCVCLLHTLHLKLWPNYNQTASLDLSSALDLVHLIFSAVSVLVLSSIELKMKQWNTDWNHSASCFVLLLMMAIFSSNLKTKKWISVPGGLFLCLTGSMGGQTLLVLDLIPAVSLWRVTGQMVVSLIWKENTPLIHRGELLITIKYDWFMFRLLFIKMSFF